ncbi:HNH endonuclease [Dactylosporangium cerinum]|uniref:HNH endonuclease n=1 Tax=Dactylosporangium cerinum TaxID=1434730 RepID=A0ABV9WDI5_9ACTN
MSEYVYPVNENDPEAWGYDERVLDMFRAVRPGGIADWHLGSSFRLLKAGDTIWVYAGVPYSRIVARGVAVDGPRWSEAHACWRIYIQWDTQTTRQLLSASTPPEVLSSSPRTVRTLDSAETDRIQDWLDAVRAPRPQILPKSRMRRLQQVLDRQGQPAFRAELMKAYHGRCAISGCDVSDVLQAAHIDPVASGGRDHVSNGLLLRADLHNLFDKTLIWVDGRNRVRVDPRLKNSEYAEFDGVLLRQPSGSASRPDKEALRRHRERSLSSS